MLQIEYDREKLGAVALDGSTVADATALVLGNIGENMLARRAVFLKAEGMEHISYYIHAAGTCQLQFEGL